MLYLNKEDVAPLVNLEEMVATIEKAMEIYDKRQYMQPDRITINVNEAETYVYMPCFTENIKGTKILTLSQENYRHNLPTIQGLMLLHNPQTGTIECMIDGASITAYRTGAVGATGIKYTTPDDCRSLGIVGSGVQALYQALYAATIRPIEQIHVYDILEEKCAAFARLLQQKLPGITVSAAASARQLVEQSEIIITVTTATSPVLPDDAELLRGKHFIGIGSYKPTMHEYPQSIYGLLDNIYIDVDFALEESGDLITPCAKGWFKEENIRTLYAGLRDNSIKRTQTTFYKSVGMALFDILVARNIYDKALARGVGQQIRL